MEIIQQLSPQIKTTDQALAFYDDLDIVQSNQMIGIWKGAELPTGHPMDGLLEPSGWFGKQFIDEDHVHPLLFYTNSKKKVYKGNPRLAFAFAELGLSESMIKLLSSVAKPFVQTRSSKARLRMTTYRGKTTATMCYDQLPIHDVFRKIDENTVLGAMDLKGEPLPYFFVLKRAQNALPIL